MNAQEYIKIVLVKKGLKERHLATLMDDTPQNVNRKIKSDMKISFIESVADALGCDVELKFIDRNTKEEL